MPGWWEPFRHRPCAIGHPSGAVTTVPRGERRVPSRHRTRPRASPRAAPTACGSGSGSSTAGGAGRPPTPRTRVPGRGRLSRRTTLASQAAGEQYERRARPGFGEPARLSGARPGGGWPLDQPEAARPFPGAGCLSGRPGRAGSWFYRLLSPRAVAVLLRLRQADTASLLDSRVSRDATAAVAAPMPESRPALDRLRYARVLHPLAFPCRFPLGSPPRPRPVRAPLAGCACTVVACGLPVPVSGSGGRPSVDADGAGA